MEGIHLNLFKTSNVIVKRYEMRESKSQAFDIKDDVSKWININDLTSITLHGFNSFLKKHIEDGLLTNPSIAVYVKMDDSDLLKCLIELLIENGDLFKCKELHFFWNTSRHETLTLKNTPELVVQILNLSNHVKIVQFDYNRSLGWATGFPLFDHLFKNILGNPLYKRFDIRLNLDKIDYPEAIRLVESMTFTPGFNLKFEMLAQKERVWGLDYMTQQSTGWSKGKNLILLICQSREKKGLNPWRKFPHELIKLVKTYLK